MLASPVGLRLVSRVGSVACGCGLGVVDRVAGSGDGRAGGAGHGCRVVVVAGCWEGSDRRQKSRDGSDNLDNGHGQCMLVRKTRTCCG